MGIRDFKANKNGENGAKIMQDRLNFRLDNVLQTLPDQVKVFLIANANTRVFPGTGY